MRGALLNPSLCRVSIVYHYKYESRGVKRRLGEFSIAHAVGTRENQRPKLCQEAADVSRRVKVCSVYSCVFVPSPRHAPVSAQQRTSCVHKPASIHAFIHSNTDAFLITIQLVAVPGMYGRWIWTETETVISWQGVFFQILSSGRVIKSLEALFLPIKILHLSLLLSLKNNGDTICFPNTNTNPNPNPNPNNP